MAQTPLAVTAGIVRITAAKRTFPVILRADISQTMLRLPSRKIAAAKHRAISRRYDLVYLPLRGRRSCLKGLGCEGYLLRPWLQIFRREIVSRARAAAIAGPIFNFGGRVLRARTFLLSRTFREKSKKEVARSAADGD